MTSGSFNPDLLIPCGRIFLGTSFGVCLIQSMKGSIELQVAFERLIIGFLGLVFFKSGASNLLSLSETFSSTITQLGHQDDLKTLILEAFKKAGSESVLGNPHASINLPAIMEQAWRTGVWGIMSTIVDWAFLIASFLLESARDVLWTLLLFLFPIGCGLYPVSPKILSNLTLYAIELALWFPMLSAIEVATAYVARKEMTRSESWGLYVVAVELLAIILILMIPSLTHRFLSGAFSGDLDSQSSLIRTVKKIVTFKKSMGMIG